MAKPGEGLRAGVFFDPAPQFSSSDPTEQHVFSEDDFPEEPPVELSLLDRFRQIASEAAGDELPVIFPSAAQAGLEDDVDVD